MFRKVLLISGAMLFLAAYTAHATTMSCGDISAADCKKQVMTKMDNDIMTMFVDMMKTHMMKVIDASDIIKNEMPEGGVHAKMLMELKRNLKEKLEMVDKMDGMDVRKMQTTMVDAFRAMKIDFQEANAQDSANAEKFRDAAKRYFKEGAANEVIQTMTGKFETICLETLNGLREEDMNEYPQYMEMKELIKTMSETTDLNKKLDMVMAMMKKMTEFGETPHMTAIEDMFV